MASEPQTMAGTRPLASSAVEPFGLTPRPGSVVLVGLGAIGSVAAGLLAKEPRIGRVVVIDHDAYDATNRGQDITPHDIGQPKAVVQGARLRRLNPALHVVALVEAVERVPLGVLRHSVLLCAVDSRASRVYLNAACARVGTTWVDAGVRSEGRLARVNVYAPAPDNPCLECAFDARDYELLEQTYPCEPHTRSAPATNAPACLGALAAALQVLECEKLLDGRTAQALVGRQVLVDAAWHRHYVSTFRRNGACRFDHTTWEVELLEHGPGALTIGDALALAPHSGADGSGSAFALEGQVFVGRLICPACGAARHLPWRLSGRLHADEYCVRCRVRMRATGCDVAQWLSGPHLAPGALEDPLATLGLRAGDIITVRGAAGWRHLQLGLPEWWGESALSPVIGSPPAAERREGIS